MFVGILTMALYWMPMANDFSLTEVKTANIYLSKFNHRNTRKMCKIGSKLVVKTLERRRSGVFTVNFEHISHFFLVFLLLTLNKQMLAGKT